MATTLSPITASSATLTLAARTWPETRTAKAIAVASGKANRPPCTWPRPVLVKRTPGRTPASDEVAKSNDRTYWRTPHSPTASPMKSRPPSSRRRARSSARTGIATRKVPNPRRTRYSKPTVLRSAPADSPCSELKRRQHEEHHHQEGHDHASTVERLTGQNDGGAQESRDEEQVGGEDAGGSGAATDAVLHAEWDDRGDEDEQGQVRRRGHEGERKDQRKSGQCDCDDRTPADEQAQGDGGKDRDRDAEPVPHVRASGQRASWRPLGCAGVHPAMIASLDRLAGRLADLDSSWPVSATCDVAIIGSGPYGLATAAHLRSRDGLETRVFGETMSFWKRQMPDGHAVALPLGGDPHRGSRGRPHAR